LNESTNRSNIEVDVNVRATDLGKARSSRRNIRLTITFRSIATEGSAQSTYDKLGLDKRALGDVLRSVRFNVCSAYVAQDGRVDTAFKADKLPLGAIVGRFSADP
jgi:hypothetical protein